MKKWIQKLLCPGVAAAGLAGFGLRYWLFTTGIDERGLLLTDHPAHILILLWTGLIMAALAVFVWQCPKQLRKPLPGSLVGFWGCMVAAVGILIANVLELTTANDGVTIASSVMGVLAAFGLLYMGIRRKSGHRGSMVAFTLIILYYMTHLILQYRMWSAQSQLQIYFFPLMASVFLMLFAYHRAALDVHGNHFRRYIFFNQAALFCCLLSLNTDSWLFYLAMAVWAATDLYIPEQTQQEELV